MGDMLLLVDTHEADRQNGWVMLDCILCAGLGSSCADMPWLRTWFSLFRCQVGTLTTVLF
jgi:hypothetical protein